MDNIHHFNEIKLVKIILPIILVVIFLVLLFTNFHNKYGIIPTEENIYVGDTVAKVVIVQGLPESIAFENESKSLYLEYSNKEIFGLNMDAVYTFSNNALYEISYSSNKMNTVNLEETYSEVCNAISDNLNSDFIYKESTNLSHKLSEWSYSTGARNEIIDVECGSSEIDILIHFQW